MYGSGAAGRRFHSRFQVLTAGELAWAQDEKGHCYRFDGFFFSRRERRRDTFSLVASWQTPSYGWLLASQCPCLAWVTDQAARPAVTAEHPAHLAA